MNKGFSILELVISLAIMAVIIGLSVASFTLVEEKKQLDAAANAVFESITTQKVNAYVNKTVDGSLPKAFCFAQDSGDFDSYYLFADMDGDYIFDEDVDFLQEKASLPRKVRFHTYQEGIDFCVTFNPDPKFCNFEGKCGDEIAGIEFELIAGEHMKYIIINTVAGTIWLEG
jgi:prepilin-type N-terminal cleavage/methylation domain-containing protein